MHPFRNSKHRTYRAPWSSDSTVGAAQHHLCAGMGHPSPQSPLGPASPISSIHGMWLQSSKCKGDGLRGHASTRKMFQYYFIIIIGIQ